MHGSRSCLQALSTKRSRCYSAWAGMPRASKPLLRARANSAPAFAAQASASPTMNRYRARFSPASSQRLDCGRKNEFMSFTTESGTQLPLSQCSEILKNGTPTSLLALIVSMCGLLLAPGTSVYACGPYFSTAVFTYTLHPDYPLADFAGGQLGLASADLRSVRISSSRTFT